MNLVWFIKLYEYKKRKEDLFLIELKRLSRYYKFKFIITV